MDSEDRPEDQKCFEHLETLCNFTSSWVWVDKDWILNDWLYFKPKIKTI